MQYIMDYQERKRISIRCILLLIYILSLPFGTVNIPLGGSVLKYIAILPVIVNIIHVLKKKKFIFNKISLLYIIYIFLLFVTLLFSNYFSVVSNKIITNILFIILLITASSNSYSKDEIDIIKKAYLWAARITAMIVLLLGGTMGEGRLVLNQGIFIEDPNYLCGYFIFSVVLMIDRILNKDINRIIIKIISILELGVYFFIIISTGSRGGLIGIFIAIIAYMIIFLFKMKKNLKIIVKYAVMIVFLVMSIQMIINILPQGMKERFVVENIVEGRGTGRLDLWNNAIKIYENSESLNKLIGHGLGSIRVVDVNGYHMKNVVHNFWIEELVEQGIIGLIVIIVINIYCLYITLKKKEYVFTASLMGMIGLSLSLSIRAFKPWWNLIIITSIISNYSLKTNEDNKKI